MRNSIHVVASKAMRENADTRECSAREGWTHCMSLEELETKNVGLRPARRPEGSMGRDLMSGASPGKSGSRVAKSCVDEIKTPKDLVGASPQLHTLSTRGWCHTMAQEPWVRARGG